jgi:hypothetical protein
MLRNTIINIYATDITKQLKIMEKRNQKSKFNPNFIIKPQAYIKQWNHDFKHPNLLNPNTSPITFTSVLKNDPCKCKSKTIGVTPLTS